MENTHSDKFILIRLVERMFVLKPPCNHQSCMMSSIKGLRNGIYYGGKIRFMHALVMTILFRKGTL